MDEALGYFLDLRVRVRGNAYAVDLVDRCLRMIAQAAVADAAGYAALERELEGLRRELRSPLRSRGSPDLALTT